MNGENNAGDTEETAAKNDNIANESSPLLPDTRNPNPQQSPAKSEPRNIRRENKASEIEDSTINATEESSPLLADIETNDRAQPAQTNVPEVEVEVHLFLCGEGPIDVFKSRLGGWEQNKLEIRQILEKYGLKMVYGFNPLTGRGVPIRFNPRNGQSILPYNDGAVLNIDGEPKDSIISPITRIILWITFICLLLVMFMNQTPDWAKKMNLSFQTIPPWMLTCAIIIFTRISKRTRTFLKTIRLY